MARILMVVSLPEEKGLEVKGNEDAENARNADSSMVLCLVTSVGKSIGFSCISLHLLTSGIGEEAGCLASGIGKEAGCCLELEISV